MPKIYGVPPSPFVRKVRLALGHKGIDCDFEMVSPFGMPPEVRAKSPLGKIPIYEEGDFAIADSSVIIDYLERTHPKPALYPADPKLRAKALFLEEFADSKLAEACGTVFFNRFVKVKLLKQESDEGAVKTALTEALPPLLDWLEGQVGKGDFLVGDQYSVADIGVSSQLRQLELANESIDSARWPKLAAWQAKMQKRPDFQSFIAQEDQLVAGA